MNLDDALRDRLVCGLHAEGTQRRLLIIKNLMLQEAIKTALSMEAAKKDSKALQGKYTTGFQDSDTNKLEAVSTLLLMWEG